MDLVPSERLGRQSSQQTLGGILELLKATIAWLIANGPAVAAAILGLLAVAETITRLTPTKTDDLFVERIGSVIRKIFEVLNVPSNKAGGGVHEPAPVETKEDATKVDESKAS